MMQLYSCKRFFFGWDGPTLFIPAAVFGMSDWEAAMCCAHDMERTYLVKKTVLVNEQWARRERPDMAALIDKIKAVAEDVKARLPELDTATTPKDNDNEKI